MTETVGEQCERYRTQHAMTAAYINQHHRIILPVGAVGGIWLPAALAAPVRAALGERGWSTPILAVPRPGMLIVLTEGAAPLHGDASWQRRNAQLFGVQATPAVRGSTIPLPTTPDHDDRRGRSEQGSRYVSGVSWIDEPDGATRCPFQEVASLILEVTKSTPGQVRRG
ncbi:hypothetical protein ACWDYH_36300 [Nocardia goodfellowii]